MSTYESEYAGVIYTYRLCLIEALRKANLNDISIITAYEYGKSSFAVWRDSPALVQKFLETNRNNLIQFNIDKFIKVLGFITKGFYEVTPKEYNALPMAPADMQVLANAFRNAALWLENSNKSGINEMLDFDVAESSVKFLFDTLYDRTHYPSDASCLNNEYVVKCFRCLMNKGEIDLDKIKELIDKSRASNTVLDCTEVVLKTLLQIVSIMFHLHYPKSIHPASLEKMVKSLNGSENYNPAYRNVSTLNPFELIKPTKVYNQKIPQIDTDIPQEIKNIYFNGESSNYTNHIQRSNTLTELLLRVQSLFHTNGDEALDAK